jgi:diguanylate cyclase (GGDEF)-like protein
MSPFFHFTAAPWCSFQRWRGLCGLLGLSLLSVFAQVSAAAPLVLDVHTPRVDMWSAVKVLPDPSHQLDINQVLERASQFEAPRTAHATLGIHPEPVWLQVPFVLSAAAGSQWILDIDYPPLKRIDVYLVRGTQVLQQGVLGSLYNDPAHPRVARAHALTLQLEPGQAFALLLRIETDGAMIVPITLNTPDAFLAHALREQLLQGLMISLLLCLVLYSVMLWFSSRDVFFLKYTLIVLGGLLFSLLLSGIGAQYVWTGNHWMERHVAPLAALLSTLGFFLFFDHVVAEPGRHRAFSRIMKTGAALTVLVGALFAADLITTRVTSALVSVLGVAPSLLVLPLAIRRVRQRDPMAIYFLLAALVYCAAAFIMSSLIFGRTPVNFWTLHSVQLAGLLDALLLGRLLSLRTQAAQHAAHSATLERDAMHTLASTDPLTGLPNRRGLQTALTAALAPCTTDSMVAVFVLDLDGFKPINDQYGHDVGDELLVAVARRLQSQVRSHDVVARVGGDEFVVVVNGLIDAERAIDLGDQILVAFRAPFQLNRHRCQIGLTIGYALAPLDGKDAKVLLKIADAGMYSGKHQGKNCVRRVAQGLPVGT